MGGCSMIRPGLSGRIIETSTEDGREYDMTVPEFISASAEIGYRAVELRWWQLNDDSSHDEVATVAKSLGENGVAAAFVNCLVDPTDEGLEAVDRMSEIARQLAAPCI